MPESPDIDVSETKTAAASLLDQQSYRRPANVLQNEETQGALETLRKDATILANDPNFMKDQWELNQQLDGFPKIMINDDRSITISGGFSDGSRTILVKPNEIDVTDEYGQKDFSGTETARKFYEETQPVLQDDAAERVAFVQDFSGQPYINPDQTGWRATGDPNPTEAQFGIWPSGEALPFGNQTTLQRVPNNYPQIG